MSNISGAIIGSTSKKCLYYLLNYFSFVAPVELIDRVTGHLKLY